MASPRGRVAGLARLLDRDLAGLSQQLELWPAGLSLWEAPGGMGNPPGNLVLHLCGNLRHFVGAQLGGSGYQRQRELEFSRRDVPAPELSEEISRTREEVAAALAATDDAALERAWPAPMPWGPLPAGLFLEHLCVHLAYHLGQLDALRRRDGAPALPMISPAALAPGGEQP